MKTQTKSLQMVRQTVTDNWWKEQAGLLPVKKRATYKNIPFSKFNYKITELTF